MAAAHVQFDLTALVRRVQRALLDLYERGSWSQDYTSVSAAFIETGADYVRRWRELAPPSELQPQWEEILGAFEQLGPQLEALASLKDVPPEALRPRLVSCQSGLAQWLDRANAAERKLAEAVFELAIANVEAHDDSVPRQPPPT